MKTEVSWFSDWFGYCNTDLMPFLGVGGGGTIIFLAPVSCRTWGKKLCLSAIYPPLRWQKRRHAHIQIRGCVASPRPRWLSLWSPSPILKVGYHQHFVPVTKDNVRITKCAPEGVGSQQRRAHIPVHRAAILSYIIVISADKRLRWVSSCRNGQIFSKLRSCFDNVCVKYDYVKNAWY